VLGSVQQKRTRRSARPEWSIAAKILSYHHSGRAKPLARLLEEFEVQVRVGLEVIPNLDMCLSIQMKLSLFYPIWSLPISSGLFRVLLAKIRLDCPCLVRVSLRTIFPLENISLHKASRIAWEMPLTTLHYKRCARTRYDG